jgi:hypothetical protein
MVYLQKGQNDYYDRRTMAHYAYIKDNIVREVITGKDEDDTASLPDGFSSWEDYYLTKRDGMDSCLRTSYNTSKNAHTDGGTAFRGNYAGINYTYDSTNDVFIPPQDYPSWVIDEDTWTWKAPVDKPDDGKEYDWDEVQQEWVERPE